MAGETIVKFINGETSSYNIDGELTRNIRTTWENQASSYIQDIVIGDKISSIGAAAFFDCNKLTNIIILSNVTNIGIQAFTDCTSLSTIVIPNSISKISDYTFQGCRNLTSISLPTSITNIGSMAFYRCNSLNKILIPDGVLSIRNNTFQNCIKLTNVTIGKNLNTIGSAAFAGCEQLSTIYFNGNTAFNIENDTFDGIDQNCTLYVKDNSIGWNTTIPGTWKGINISYQERSKFTIIPTQRDFIFNIAQMDKYDINIPIIIDWGDGSTSYIDERSVSHGYVPNHQYIITIANVNSYTIIGDYPIITPLITSTQEILKKISFDQNIKQLGKKSLFGCHSLLDVQLNDNLEIIQASAFYNCRSLTEILIPNSTLSIGKQAFNNCDSLSNITFGNNLSSIEASAFAYCESLPSITIPNNVEYIGESAFYECTSLQYAKFNGSSTENAKRYNKKTRGDI